MTEFFIPADIRFILDSISEKGFESYLVGGSVRDCLSGRTPSDFDIATDALPETVSEIFKGYTYLTERGFRHGTVGVTVGSFAAEITTYRSDGVYTDNRHPETVRFSSRLEEDVMRRDFTVNAMAYSPRFGFKDLVGGLKDLENGIIRCVGEPESRFEEDSLRILRALRFSSVLGFTVDSETSEAIFAKAHLLKNVSAERIFAEFSKLICGKNAESVLLEYRNVFEIIIPEISPMFDFEQRTPYHKYDVYTHSVHAVSFSNEKDLVLRLTAFFHDIGKPSCFFSDENGIGHFYGHAKKSTEIAEDCLMRLKCPADLKQNVLALIKYHDLQIENEANRIKRLLGKLGEEQFFRLLNFQRADNSAQSETVAYRRQKFDLIESTARKILAEKACFSLADMKINGTDLIGIGMKEGKKIGTVLNLLLNDVIDNIIPNDREELMRRALKYKGD